MCSSDLKLRLQYPGAIYHVMNRGDRQEAIFEDEADRERFLETLAVACFKTGWQVHAYCLMGNHLVAGMQWFLSTYTARFYRRHRRFGHLFSGRYKSLIVDGGGSKRWIANQLLMGSVSNVTFCLKRGRIR